MKQVLYSEEKMRRIHSLWEKFIAGELEDGAQYPDLNEDVYASWKRSVHYHIDAAVPAYKEISGLELEETLQRHARLIRTAEPYMRKLREIVDQSQFIVVLADENGIILKSFGAGSLLERPEASTPGADRSERAIGCNAIGTALHNDRPVQIWGTENYNINYQTWTCSAATIHDPDGRLIGVIDLSGAWQEAHLHTLGMVIAAADSIERELKLAREQLRRQYSQTVQNAAFATINEGLIVLDRQGLIRQINQHACSILDMPSPESCVNQALETVTRWDRAFIRRLTEEDFINSEEVDLIHQKAKYRCYLSASPLFVEGSRYGTILVLRDGKQIREIIHRSLGTYASFTFDDILGHSAKIREAVRMAKKAAQSSSSVLLLGESGTGKELFAQAIHNSGARASRPFIDINCGAIPRNLIESELFGYEKGAFTGADRNGRMGKFELADGGTLLLDEIGDMPYDLQVSLLRVLQNHEVVRIGGYTGKKVDVRIIASTNRDLRLATSDRAFREDLFYRLNVFSIVIPPLRERKEDIPEISGAFIRKQNVLLKKNVTGLTDDALRTLCEYDWPGNVRELENIIERAMNLTEGSRISSEDLLIRPAGYSLNKKAENKSIAELTRDRITTLLKHNRGNIRATALQAGVSRSTLYRMMQKYGLRIEDYR